MRALHKADVDVQQGEKPTAHREVGQASTGCEDCGELLHGLNNALASVLLNAQVMAWKLPSYSRGKRYLHEIERNSQPLSLLNRGRHHECTGVGFLC